MIELEWWRWSPFTPTGSVVVLHTYVKRMKTAFMQQWFAGNELRWKTFLENTVLTK